MHDAFELPGFQFALFRSRNNKDELISSRSKTVASYGLRHGDMLYLSPLNGALLWENPKPGTSKDVDSSSSAPKNSFIGKKEIFYSIRLEVTSQFRC